MAHIEIVLRYDNAFHMPSVFMMTSLNNAIDSTHHKINVNAKWLYITLLYLCMNSIFAMVEKCISEYIVLAVERLCFDNN